MVIKATSHHYLLPSSSGISLLTQQTLPSHHSFSNEHWLYLIHLLPNYIVVVTIGWLDLANASLEHTVFLESLDDDAMQHMTITFTEALVHALVGRLNSTNVVLAITCILQMHGLCQLTAKGIRGNGQS